MDPDQDLLDQLDRKEGASVATVMAMIIGLSVGAGLVGYFTLLQASGRELAADGGGLIAIVAAAGLLVAYRMFR
jgi:hypothetical protein